jgi:DNA polymerase III subunit alpha
MIKHFELHSHTEYSIFDGLGKIKRRVQRAKELKYTSLGISDHGNTCGLVQHYFECKKEGIKPILGVEAYYQPEFNKEEPRYHLCIFAKNNKGYENLNKIQTLAAQENFYRKPHVTEDLLVKYGEGLIVSTACVGGYPAQLVLDEKEGKAFKVLEKWQKLFGDDLYIEIMPFKIDENGTQEYVNRVLYDFGTKLNIKCIITTDSHFVYKDDIDTHRVMFGMSNRDMGDTYVGRHMQSEKEVITMCKEMHPNMDIDKMLDNIQGLPNKCDVNIEFTPEETFPKYESGKDNKKFIRDLMVAELKRKGLWEQKYFDRLKYELEVIEELGYVDYFLIIWDMMKFCTENGISKGVRGSAGNSMTTNALGMTEIDPLKLGNIFERFLRHGKTKLVDVDLDVSSRRRQEVIDYIERRYPNRTAPITNFSTWQTKNLANELGKYFDVTPNELTKMKEYLEKIIGGRSRTELVTFEELKKNSYLAGLNEKYDKIIVHFSKLWGQVKSISRHAGGVAITKDDITKYTALIKSKGVLQTAYDMDTIDSIKVLKLDILGVAHLDIMQDVEKLVGETFSYEKIEDSQIYSILRDGQTQGIFQIESVGATAKTVKVQPQCIQDLIALNAVIRPAASMEDFISGKQNGIEYSNPWWKFAEDSYGAIIYQETVMMILKDFAGMEWHDVERLIKILDEPVTEEKLKFKEMFMQGVQGKLTKVEASELWDKMTQYLYNKGHASAYAIIGAWETYLKYHYPTEFYWSILYNNIGDNNKMTYYIHHAICSGIFFLKPSVNSTANFSLEEIGGEKFIRIGLAYLDGIGIGTAEYIEANGKYESKDDLISKVKKQKVNSKTLTALEKSNAFEMDLGRQIEDSIMFNKIMKKRSVFLK